MLEIKCDILINLHISMRAPVARHVVLHSGSTPTCRPSALDSAHESRVMPGREPASAHQRSNSGPITGASTPRYEKTFATHYINTQKVQRFKKE